MANWPTNQEVNTSIPEIEEEEVNQSEIINTTEAPVVEQETTTVEQVDPTVTEDVIVETAPAEDIVETSPVVEETTSVETPVIEQEQRPSLDLTEEQVRQALQLTASRGLDATESVAKVRESLERRGFDTSAFEKQFAPTIQEFSQFDTSSDDFFSGLSQWQTYPSFIQKSANYQSAKTLFDKVRAQDSSENGLYQGLKNNSIDPAVLVKLNQDPVVAENINKANKRIIRENLRDGTTKSLYELPVGQQTQALDIMMEELGLNKSKATILEEDNILSTNSEAYIESVDQLNKLYKKREGLRGSLRSKYPNASENFINAMYDRENQALESQIDELEASGSTYKSAYDFRLGELKTGFDLEKAQDENKFALFRDVQRNNFSLYLDEIKRADEWTVSNFQFLSPWSGVIARTDKKTGDVKFFNTQNVWEVYNETTGKYEAEPIETAGGVIMSWSGTDLRNSNYVSKYPRNASFKNNNPAGLTFTATSESLKNKFKSFGIDIAEGTDRPANEGGSYISFNTLNDGLDAMKISFYETGFSDIKSRLMAWKGAGTEAEKEAYANDIIEATFGDTQNRNFNEMSYKDREKLLTQHLKREDSALYSVLNDEMGAIREDGTLDYSLLKTKATSNKSVDNRIADIAGITVEVFGSRASDWEREAVESVINSMPWASRDQIIGAIRGYKFNNDEDANFGASLLNTARTSLSLSDIDLPGVASLIRWGNRDVAINKIELSVDGKIKSIEGENYVSETNTRQVFNKVNELNQLVSDIEKATWDSIGAFEWTIEGWLGRFKSGDAAAIASKATLLIAKMRKDLIGANITAAESSTLEPIVPELKDSTTNFLIKTESLKTDTLTNLNSQRARYWLPEIDEEGLLDLKERLKIYEGEREADLSNETLSIVNEDLNKESQNPIYNFAAGSVIWATQVPTDYFGILTQWQTSINIDSSMDIISEIATPLKLLDDSQHPINAFDKPSSLELFNRLLPSALQKATGWENLWLEGKTVTQFLSEQNSDFWAAAYDFLWVDAEATSTKVGEFVSPASMFSVWLIKNWGKLAWTGLTPEKTYTVLNKIDKKIENDFIWAIKPSNFGKSANEQERYRAKARQAVLTITGQKGDLKLVDEFGEQVANKLPNTVHQFNDSVGQVKKALYQQYNSLTQEAWISNSIDFNPIIKELEILKNNRQIRDLPNSNATINYIDSIIKSFSEESGKRNVLDAEKIKQWYNSRLSNYYKNPTQEGVNSSTIDAFINNMIGKQLDETIEAATGKEYTILKQQYGALSTIEKDVATASAREFKKAGQSFIDYSDIFSAGDVSGAIVSGNAGYLAKWGSQFLLKEWYKKINSPDTKIKKMFNNADKALYSK